MRIERDRLIQARARQFAIKAGWIPVRDSRNFITITERSEKMNWFKRTFLNWRWWICLPIALTVLVLALVAKSISLTFEFLALPNELVQSIYAKIDHKGSSFVRRYTFWSITGK